MQLKLKTSQQLSLAVGLLSAAAFIIGELGGTWGFEALAHQIVQTILAFVAAINIYFLGHTSNKISAEKEKENGKEK